MSTDTQTLNSDEVQRYARHLILPEFGKAGQEKLKASKVLCVGAGGLGSPMAMYLAAAGVGTLGIMDFDVVDVSNLQRQIIHGQASVGERKVVSAANRIKDINPHVNVKIHETAISSANAREITREYDVVADGTDNFPTRYLVNDACVLEGKVNVYASIFRFDGQATVFGMKDGPCYRCLYPDPPPPGMVPSCAEGGVLGVLPGIMGTLQALEVIKVLTGIGDPLKGRLMVFDALSMKFRELKIRKDPKCPICGESRTIHELIDYNQFCGIPNEEAQKALDAQKATEVNADEITPAQLKERMDKGDKPYLVDVRNANELDICKLPFDAWIPLPEFGSRWEELADKKDTEVVIYCRSGGRSGQVVRFLQEQGFSNVRNMIGGMLRWSDDVDSTVAKY
ncbi:MAG: molybdopterin-synthase adenylyltransferase MoeB [Planctomycetes bacterium]|nr:molybdopterin-synthase adenylyltransferase MoeB [Planctomycetota bacterium]MCA8937627.1 molybdopterin-synthase adenylyltransferase MoeB [Planctomycetota bacterium]